jgi:RHS repeat-associated protein
MIERDRDADATGGLEERLYVQQDANWNVTGMVTTTGSVAERFVYESYGEVNMRDGAWKAKSGSDYGWKDLFQGRRLDGDSNTYDYRNRVYSMTRERFDQPDPVDSVNLYESLNNQPNNYLDPLGEESLLTFRPQSPGDILHFAEGKVSVTYTGVRTKPALISLKDCAIISDVTITARAWRTFPADKASQDKETRVIYVLVFEHKNRRLACPCQPNEHLEDSTYRSWGGPLQRAVLIRPNLDNFARNFKPPATIEEFEKEFHDGALGIESTIDPPKK